MSRLPLAGRASRPPIPTPDREIPRIMVTECPPSTLAPEPPLEDPLYLDLV